MIEEKLKKAIELLDKHQFQDVIEICSSLENQSMFQDIIYSLRSKAELNLKNHAVALEYAKKAYILVPQEASYGIDFARICVLLGGHKEAVTILKSVLINHVRNEEAHELLTSSLKKLSLFRQVIEQARESLKIFPENPGLLHSLGFALHQSDQTQEAIEVYQQLLPLLESKASVYCAMGELSNAIGETPNALRYYQQAIDEDETGMEAFHGISTIQKLGPDDPLVLKLEKVISTQKLDDVTTELAHHIMGKIYHDNKDYERAFHHHHTANNTRLKSDNYPELYRKDVEHVEWAVANLNKENLEQNPANIHLDIRPIFIVGMPRSGTTLLQQIISMHPDYVISREFEFVKRIWNSLCPDVYKNNERTGINYNLLKKTYLDSITNQFGPQTYFIDKMPKNFLYLNLIYKMFPQAKIIHSVRSPIDTCLSCYFTRFASNSHNYSIDLEWLQQFYLLYQKSINHFKAVLPIPILEIQYEDVVQDQERTSKKIFEFCDLVWKPEYIDFKSNKNTVTTASVSQVRQEVYTSSIEKWKPYEKFIGPLLMLK